MTRWAVISDIHGNAEALQAAAAVIVHQQVDRILCLGDVVGYGAQPQTCLEWVQQNCQHCVLGNHEMMVMHDDLPWKVRDDVRQVIRWTRTACSSSLLEQVKHWPLILPLRSCLMVHGSPWEPEQFHYIFSPWDASQAFEQAGEALILVGHTHRPAFIEVAPGKSPRWNPLSNLVTLLPDKRYIINVGSIGQPRNGDPRAQWLIWDDTLGIITFHATPYAIDRAQRKILDAGLPRWFAERLAQGY